MMGLSFEIFLQELYKHVPSSLYSYLESEMDVTDVTVHLYNYSLNSL